MFLNLDQLYYALEVVFTNFDYRNRVAVETGADWGGSNFVQGWAHQIDLQANMYLANICFNKLLVLCYMHPAELFSALFEPSIFAL